VSIIGGRDLARLYEQHAPAALRLAYLLTGDHGLAEDLVQDAFVRVIGRFGQLRDELGFDAHLRHTVVNLSCGRLPQTRVEREGVDERDELWRRLGSVAPRQRAALVLRHYENLSDEQAAQVLGCSTRALRSLTSRGLQALGIQESVVAR